MKIIEKEINGSIEGITSLLIDVEPVITTNIKGDIIMSADIYATKNSTRKVTCIIAEYTGSFSYNGGIVKGKVLPFQMTVGAKKVWNAFIDRAIDKFIEYLKTK